MDIRQCFEIFELDTDASIDDVNQAYKDLAAVWHPDRFASNPRLKKKTEEKLKTVNQAYEKVLSFLSTEQEVRQSEPSHGVASRSLGSCRSDGSLKGASKIGALFHSKRKTTEKSQLRPWIRFFSRIIDYLFFAFLLKLTGVDNIFPETEFRVLFIPVILAFAWIIPEAGLLSMFGTTPGKWVLGTAVVDIFQLKPKFSSALRRSLSVWCNGMGMGVFFIAPITALVACFRIKTRGSTVWDSDGGITVKHSKIGAPRAVIAFLSSVVIVLFLFFDPDIMIEAYRQAVRMKPDDAGTHLKLGDSYAKAGRYSEAIEAYGNALKIEPDYAQAYYNLGRCSVELECYNEALPPFKKSISLNPKFADAYYDLGVCYAKLHHTGKAVEALKQAIRLKSDYARAYHELGVCYVELERYEEAIETSKKAIKINPEYAPAHYNLGICYSRLRRTEEAVRSFKVALRIETDFTEAYYNLGISYVELGRYNDAVGPFKRALEFEPEYAQAFYSLGVCYAKLHHTGKAVEALKQAVRLKPDYAEAYHILGLSYLTLGKNSDAREQYDSLKDLDKGLADELLDYIENMPNLP